MGKAKLCLINHSLHKISITATIQILIDIGLFDHYDHADDPLKEYLTFKGRRKEEVHEYLVLEPDKW